MYQTIAEPIYVAGVYDSSGFKVVKFKWRQRQYIVEQVTFKAEVKDGGVRGRMYSVVAGGTAYRLYFNRDSERWRLEELWVE
jgi:hypothetical protein